MRQFTDKRGRTWSLDFTVGAVEKLRATTQYNFADIEVAMAFLSADVYEVVAVLSAAAVLVDGGACGPEIPLADSLAGDLLGAARLALIDEIVDFFHEPNRREALRRMLAQLDEASERVHRAFIDRVARTDLASGLVERMNAELDAAVVTPAGTRSGPSPESSG